MWNPFGVQVPPPPPAIMQSVHPLYPLPLFYPCPQQPNGFYAIRPPPVLPSSSNPLVSPWTMHVPPPPPPPPLPPASILSPSNGVYPAASNWIKKKDLSPTLNDNSIRPPPGLLHPAASQNPVYQPVPRQSSANLEPSVPLSNSLTVPPATLIRPRNIVASNNLLQTVPNQHPMQIQQLKAVRNDFLASPQQLDRIEDLQFIQNMNFPEKHVS